MSETTVLCEAPRPEEPVIAEICEALALGEPLRSICRRSNIPAFTTVYEAARNHPDIAARIARSRQIGADAIADETFEIADNLEEDPASRKVRVWTRLQLLAKWQPDKYGEKASQSVNVAVGVQINALSEEKRAKLVEKKRASTERRKAARLEKAQEQKPE